MSTQIAECEQYVFHAHGKRNGARKSEALLIFESPLDDKGTFFMVQTTDGEERASYVSHKTGWEAMCDMRANITDIRFTRVSRTPQSDRPGPRLILLAE